MHRWLYLFILCLARRILAACTILSTLLPLENLTLLCTLSFARRMACRILSASLHTGRCASNLYGTWIEILAIFLYCSGEPLTNNSIFKYVEGPQKGLKPHSYKHSPALPARQVRNVETHNLCICERILSSDLLSTSAQWNVPNRALEHACSTTQ